MNTIWSDYVQGIGTLYSSRVLRFSDDVKYKYIKAFMLEEKKKILEIGCGPGALGEAAVEPWEIEELKRLINEKYNKRLELYDEGVKQWDTHVSVTMIARGVKQ